MRCCRDKLTMSEKEVKPEDKKKGGRFTILERILRQREVYRLYLECGFSAVKIADMLNVNRNTVNDDIRQLNDQLTTEWNAIRRNTFCMKQIHRYDSQRLRLLEAMQNHVNIKDKVAIEKLIFEIDNKITKFVNPKI